MILTTLGKIRVAVGLNASNIWVWDSDNSYNSGSLKSAIVYIGRSTPSISLCVNGVSNNMTAVTSTGVITGSINSSSFFYVGRRANAGSTLFYTGSLGFSAVSIGQDLTADASEIYNGGIPICYDDLSAPLKAKFTSFWELSNWAGHTSQELTDQAGGNNLTNNGSTPFNDNGQNIQCS